MGLCRCLFCKEFFFPFGHHFFFSPVACVPSPQKFFRPVLLRENGQRPLPAYGVHDVTSRSGNKNKLSQIANIFQIRLFNFVFQVSFNINAKLNKPDILLANLVRFV